MKRFAKCPVAILAFVLVAGISLAQAQTAFKIPFDFQAGGKKLPKGDYTVAMKADGQVVLKQEATGKEVAVAVLKKLEKPTPPPAGPRLVFDEVGDFAPSYTEYLTVYILAEVWLAGQDGLEVHVTKGAHKTKVVEGPKAK
jgi:hypothetical protein